MTNTVEIAIVGTGPSGVYCALQLIEEYKKIGSDNYLITLFDSSRTLKTLLPTGNGRCNLGFDEADFKKFASYYPRGEKFLYSIFSRYFTPETLAYFKKIGVETYIQPDRRIFPVSNSAENVSECMISELRKSKKIKFIKNNVRNVQELCKFNKIILAAGSKGTAELAQQFGHTIIPLKSALCGLRIKNEGVEWPKGVSLHTPDGGIIFTDQGVSGPHIYKISSINAYKEYPYKIEIPLIKPEELFKEINANPKKSFKNIVSNFIPKSLAKAILGDNDKQCAQVKNEEVYNLKTLVLTITGVDNNGEIVHAGGVSLKEVDRNCKSKIKDNLWIIGEGLDIDGLTGGFNLQNCWSSAAIAAFDISNA